MLDANLPEKELQQTVYDLKDEKARNRRVYHRILRNVLEFN